MEAFLSIILIVILGFYLAGALGKLLLRHWLSKKLGNINSQGSFFGNWQARNAAARDEDRREGEIRIDQRRTSSKKVNRNVGDYVDYEELNR